jgi:sugar/nucleoside kinase (ribokinase family)
MFTQIERHGQRQPMADVVVLGTVAGDIVLKLDALPRPGEHVSGEPLGWRPGGGSANVARGLAAGGHRVELIGPVGNDEMAEALLAELRRCGVRTDRCMRVDARSPRALILIDDEGERTIVQLDRGSAADGFALPDPPDLDGADCVYVESYRRFPGVAGFPPREAMLVAAPPEVDGRAWPADVLVGSASQYRAEWLAAPFESARIVAGPRLRWVVITRGRAGADAYGPDGWCHADAREARQVDATGAGDAFAAGLLHGLLAGGPIQEAMELGAEHGAAAVELMQSVPPEWIDSAGPTPRRD